MYRLATDSVSCYPKARRGQDHKGEIELVVKAVDLFAGAGGLSLGATLAGVEVAMAVEVDTMAVNTYKANFNHVDVLHKSVTEISEADLAKIGPIDILLAGPPCQAFSTSNQRTRNNSNPLNNLLFEPVRLSRISRPTWIIIENVPGLEIGTRKPFIEKLIGDLKKGGYTVSAQKLLASSFGVPQNRTRLFVIAGPKPFDNRLLDQFLIERHITVDEAIMDLPPLENGATDDVLPYCQPATSEYAARMRQNLQISDGHLTTNNAPSILERYSHIPQGGNWRDIPVELMDTYTDHTRCHTGIYHRLSGNVPAKVIGNFRKNMLIHPRQHRGISVREAARLQSFPDWFTFKGSIGKKQQQAGNAVPPLLARAVIRSICEQT